MKFSIKANAEDHGRKSVGIYTIVREIYAKPQN